MNGDRDKTGNSHINNIYLLSSYGDDPLFNGQIIQWRPKAKFHWVDKKVNKTKMYSVSVNDKCHVEE